MEGKLWRIAAGPDGSRILMVDADLQSGGSASYTFARRAIAEAVLRRLTIEARAAETTSTDLMWPIELGGEA